MFTRDDYPEHIVCKSDDSNYTISEQGLYQDDNELSECSINWSYMQYNRPYGNYTYKTKVDRIAQVMLRVIAFNEGYDLKNSDNTYKSDKTLCSLVNSTKPSKEWLKLQEEYTDNLSEYDRMLIKYYTYHGNKVINSVLRNNDSDQAYNLINIDDEFVNEYIPEYFSDNPDVDIIKKKLVKIANDLNNLIINAPRLDKEIVVYRGVNNKDFFKPGKHVIKGIMSTSLLINVAMIYPQKIDNTDVHGFLAFINIPINTPVLFLGYSKELTDFIWEKEILIPHNFYYIVDNKFSEMDLVTLKLTDKNEIDSLTYGFCLDKDNPKKVITTDITIITS